MRGYLPLELTLTEEYIEALKQVMQAEIIMMRDQDKENSEVWYCGGVEIGNLASGGGVVFCYGAKDDVERIKADSQIFIEVPFE